MSDRHGHQELHLFIHLDDRLDHFLDSLICLLKDRPGITQQVIDEITEKLKITNDSLDEKLVPKT